MYRGMTSAPKLVPKTILTSWFDTIHMDTPLVVHTDDASLHKDTASKQTSKQPLNTSSSLKDPIQSIIKAVTSHRSTLAALKSLKTKR
uniref:Uncharacterized protein n=1 Tax=Glossina austeni TaxID=7395 RepID=A0A1A9VUV9_GLOAU